MVSLSTLDWPGSCCTDQAVLKLMEILLPPHLKVLGLKEYKTTLSTLSFQLSVWFFFVVVVDFCLFSENLALWPRQACYLLFGVDLQSYLSLSSAPTSLGQNHQCSYEETISNVLCHPGFHATSGTAVG